MYALEAEGHLFSYRHRKTVNATSALITVNSQHLTALDKCLELCVCLSLCFKAHTVNTDFDVFCVVI